MLTITSVKINTKDVLERVLKSKTFIEKGWVSAQKKVNPSFKIAQAKLLRAFDRHPVTREINSGAEATNISNTMNGYGNLFSFIGFEDGSNPTGPLRNMLLMGTELKKYRYQRGSWQFRVVIPTMQQIAIVTPMPWEKGNSWAEGIEKGISNFSFYINKKYQQGRSGEGVQAKVQLRAEDFNPMPYISQMLENFQRLVKKAY
jgi:hypothetical protein